MESAFVFTAVIAGVLCGLGTWVVMRGRVSAVEARLGSENQVEQARSNERMNFKQQELATATAGLKEVGQQAALLREQLDTAREEKSQLAERASRVLVLESEATLTEEKLGEAQREITRLSAEVASLTSKLEGEVKQSEEKLQLLSEAKTQLSDQFKSLASEILEDKSKRFTEQNQTNINQLLEPLKNKISEFQGKVEEVYVQEGKDRSALAEQVKQMLQLNQQLSQDTLNLTQALKGQAKAQGSWGELVLERVLEASGLRKGFEYDVQENHLRDDGSRVIPDVVVHL